MSRMHGGGFLMIIPMVRELLNIFVEENLTK
jgi:hypothetical protein